MPPLVGLVGKANVGKSTFFSAATLKPVPIASFPFTTVEANRGIAYLRTECVCREFGVQDNPVNSACVDGVRLIPVELIDTPGLIRGAHMGRGLGNKFLDEVRRADALIVVCDAAGASGPDGQPCKPGTHDPVEDVRIFEEEFEEWLLAIIMREWSRVARRAETLREDVSKPLSKRLSGLAITREHVLEACSRADLDPYRPTSWGREALRRFVSELRRVSKPMLVAANKVDVPVAEENVERLREAGYLVVPTSAEAELILRKASEMGLIKYLPGDGDFEVLKPGSLTEKQMKAFRLIRERVLERWGSTGVQQAINSAFFELLDMITVYPVEDAGRLTDHEGRVLPDVYLVRRGTTARQLAYMIHTELGDTFIYAVDARTGRRVGEDYVLKDRDVIQIVSAKARG